jgi:hypothetical protein
MNTKKLLSGILMAVFVFGGSLVFGEQTYKITAPEYRVEEEATGYHKISIDGFFSYGVPGYPDLPSKIYRIAVPPGVNLGSVQVEVTASKTSSLGTYRIEALPPLATWKDGVQTFARADDVYNQNAFLPQASLEFLGTSQMRKWKIVTVKYTPFQYNPITGELRHVAGVTFQIRYSKPSFPGLPDQELADRVMDERAKKILMNYSESEVWYEPTDLEYAPSQVHDYVIITTNSIVASSTKLTDYQNYLTAKGFSVLVITEDDYGSLTGQAPNGTAEKIRQWLINNYISHSIQFVLLIGNPDPSGNIPMKMCWPRRSESSDKESPTDYFYADLTGNWDYDGDIYFGEWPDDAGAGGVDFANEVYVGRIPVYSGVANLDSVLTKTMSYGNADSGAIAWRESALLPMSYSDAVTDGAYLAEYMKSNYLNPLGYSYWTLYQQGSVCAAANSIFSSEEELVDGATLSRWMSNPYGMVWWWGHGSATEAALGYAACGWGTIMNTSGSSSLNNSYPSFVYQCSCNNGYPEASNNLGTALLYNGGIATVCASRVSWYAVTQWSPGLKYYCDNASIGYFYGYELTSSGKRGAVALYDVKSDMGANHLTWWGGSHWMNLFDFNLYGDPAMSLSEHSTGHAVSVPDTPSGITEGEVGVSYDYTTGGSLCSQGHAVEYRFDWDDGNFSTWSSSATASHSWSSLGTYSVKAQARCAVTPAVTSDWSAGLTVTISACVAPAVPTDPSPLNGAISVPIDRNLDWADSSGATSYDVYFGASSPPPYYDNVTESQYDLPQLNYNTAYHWKIVAKNTCEDTAGPDWQFETQSTQGHYSSNDYQVLPGVIWAPATGGGTWITNVQITDTTGGSEVSVYFNYGGGNRRGPFVLWTGPGSNRSVKFNNILESIDTLDSGSFDYYGRVGALEFITQDSGHRILVAARTFNGNYSKTYPGLNDVASNTADTTREMLIQDLTSNSAYRSAAGFFNPTSSGVTAEIRLVNSSGSTIGSPFSKTFLGHDYQAFNPFDEAGVPYPSQSYDNVYLRVRPLSGSGRLMCYGATANNGTNDPAAHMAVALEDGLENSPCDYQILPGALWAPASGGGTWVTEIQIVDLSGGSQVSVYFNYGNGNRRGPFVLWTSPGANRSNKYGNILSAIDAVDSGSFTYYGKSGTVDFVTQDANHKIHVAARVLNGNYSKTVQTVNAYAESNTATTDSNMHIPNISNNSTYRTGTGFFNPTSYAVTVEFALYDGSGSVLGSPFTKVFVGYDYQSFNPFDEAGVPYPSQSYDNVYLRVRPLSGTGRLVCSGATANNHTNDPATHQAVKPE